MDFIQTIEKKRVHFKDEYTQSSEFSWSKSSFDKHVTYFSQERTEEYTMRIIKKYIKDKTLDFDSISVKNNVLSGQPVIKGTRVPITLILAYLRDEERFDEILEDFPTVNKDQIVESLDYLIKLIGDPYYEE